MPEWLPEPLGLAELVFIVGVPVLLVARMYGDRIGGWAKAVWAKVTTGGSAERQATEADLLPADFAALVRLEARSVRHGNDAMATALAQVREVFMRRADDLPAEDPNG